MKTLTRQRLGALLGLIIAASQLAAIEEPLLYDEPLELCRLENKDIRESSGLAASYRHENLFWTHNDSGDGPKLYCFDQQGRHRGTCKLKKAGAIDWEDMCSFELDGTPMLLVGDVGDNGAKRKSCRLYLLAEPKRPSDDVSDYRVIKLRYSTGAMDCEAIGVDPVSRKIVCVEKRWQLSCRVFEAPFPTRGASEVVAHPIARVRLPLVTAMDISSDGRRALLLTLGQGFEYRRDVGETWQEAFRRTPRKLNMPARKQGETVCYGTDGRNIFLTSEGRPTPLFLVPARGG